MKITNFFVYSKTFFIINNKMENTQMDQTNQTNQEKQKKQVSALDAIALGTNGKDSKKK